VLRAAFSYFHVTREKLLKRLLYEKCAHKMLMKLTTIINFTNILRAAFLPISFAYKTQSQTEVREKQRKTLWFEEATPKMLMKLTPCLPILISAKSFGRVSPFSSQERA